MPTSCDSQICCCNSAMAVRSDTIESCNDWRHSFSSRRSSSSVRQRDCKSRFSSNDRLALSSARLAFMRTLSILIEKIPSIRSRQIIRFGSSRLTPLAQFVGSSDFRGSPLPVWQCTHSFAKVLFRRPTVAIVYLLFINNFFVRAVTQT